MTEGTKIQISDQVRQELTAVQWGESSIVLGIEQGFRCIYCKRDLIASIEDLDTWNVEHLFPTSRIPAGQNGEKLPKEDDPFSNLVIACKLCNSIKRHYVGVGLTWETATRQQLIDSALAYVLERRKEKRARLVVVWEILQRHNIVSIRSMTRN